MNDRFDLLGAEGPWRERLAFIVDTMREISRMRDPHEMVAAYTRRMRSTTDVRVISLSRRGVEPPRFVLARDSSRPEETNPWLERERLPVLEGGVLGRIAYANDVVLEQDFEVPPADPHADVLAGVRSLLAIPVFDGGEALNMVVFAHTRPHAFDPEQIPLRVWMTNLFGRATHNLVLNDRLRRANADLDREMALIAEIQRSLLPARLPDVEGLDLAVHYRPAARAGGDYYDFLPLADGRWGVLIADVSGHGSPAAVEMAITRTLAHGYADGARSVSAAGMLAHLNRALAPRLARLHGAFVTAWFGLFDPRARTIVHATAGHPPPRLRRCRDGALLRLVGPGAPPLGVVPEQAFEEAQTGLVPGDQIVFFTDGLVEAFGKDGDLFGTERLDRTLADCGAGAHEIVRAVVGALDAFTGPRDLADDVTLLVAKIL